MSRAWPKLTSDWTVANSLVGTFGERDEKLVVALARCGTMLAYRTGPPACSPSSWPRFTRVDSPTVAGGERAELKLKGPRRTVSVRALDEAGNVGRAATTRPKGRKPPSGADRYGAQVSTAESRVRQVAGAGEPVAQVTGLGRTSCDRGEAHLQREPDS